MDASWKAYLKLADFGWIFKDEQNQTIAEGSKAEDWIGSPLMAEAMAMREALVQASTITKFTIISDSQ